ncbi:transposase [Candidatus Omnitrophota bacterium]
MSHVPRILIENACYHLIARGNQKQRVFLDEQDFKAYLERLKYYKKKLDFKLYAYCLMPNHVHLLGQVEPPKNLSKFMQGVTLSYTLYYNEKYTGVGHLWQGRFKNKVITKDRYLVDCITYIESNPVRANLVNAVHEYPWSSYRERALDQVRSEGKHIDPIEL